MKIKKLKVSNFRNLKKIDIIFWDVNILTWKNSTWKTNLTQLITNCLNTNDIVKDYFWENITTYWPWLDETTIETTIHDLKAIFQTKSWKEIKITKPIEYTFKNKISKKTLSSIEHSLDFVGEEYTNNSWKFIDYEEIINDKIPLKETKRLSIYNREFTNERNNVIHKSIENDKLLWYEYFNQFNNIVDKSIINRDNNTSFSACLSEIYNFITKTYDIDKYKDVVRRIIDWWNVVTKRQDFIEAWFINILADIQSNPDIFKNFNEDLNYFTDGILKKVEINTIWAKWFRWDIFIETPHWPNELWYISAWSAIILYFVSIKNWLELKYKETYYVAPSIMIFDELDSAIHPSLIWKFAELLKIISKDIQLFITTHSLSFINQFNRENIFLLKDMWSFNDKVEVKSNIMSYKNILNHLWEDERKQFIEMPNSELFIEWFIDSFFPTHKR